MGSQKMDVANTTRWLLRLSLCHDCLCGIEYRAAPASVLEFGVAISPSNCLVSSYGV
jgi:hypothetical protein